MMRRVRKMARKTAMIWAMIVMMWVMGRWWYRAGGQGEIRDSLAAVPTEVFFDEGLAALVAPFPSPSLPLPLCAFSRRIADSASGQREKAQGQRGPERVCVCVCVRRGLASPLGARRQPTASTQHSAHSLYNPVHAGTFVVLSSLLSLSLFSHHNSSPVTHHPPFHHLDHDKPSTRPSSPPAFHR
jgi:hypothetical protein